MDTYNHETQTYIDRMNQTTLSKFECLKPYIQPDMSVLDFGSGYSPEFIREVENAGATYVAYDASPLIQEKLREDGVTVVSDDTIRKSQYDIVFLSSVFHELLSYLSDVDYERTLDMIVGSLKPGGHIIIRDWANPDRTNQCIVSMQPDKVAEIQLWISALCYNEIIERPIVKPTMNLLKTSECDMYEIIFHTVWGVDSIAREARETYNVTHRAQAFGEDYQLQLVHHQVECDPTYLPHIQRYFDMPAIPFATKGIWVFQKTKG